jgi:hypothetical protein
MSMKAVPFSAIEPLEARIAPALLVTGANLLGGAGNPTVGEGSTGDTSLTIVKVLGGQAIVWYDGSHVVGISFGPNTTLDISGSVFGDIVGNLGANGRLSDSDHNPLNGEDGNVLLPNNLLGLTVHPLSGDPGGVFSVSQTTGLITQARSVITGGSVSNVDVNYILGGVYAGDGIFHADSTYNTGGTVVVDAVGGLDVNPVQAGVQTGFTFTVATQGLATNAPLKTGAAVKTVSVGIAVQLQIISGSGAPPGVVSTGIGGVGGNIENVTIDTATVLPGAPSTAFSYQLIAGDGANDVRGGAGGTINKVIEKSSDGKAELRAGQGGNGSAGPGGAGGSIIALDMQSNSVAYTVSAGDGGNGTPGGAGGDVNGVSFANRTANSGLVFTGDFTGDSLVDVVIVDGGTGRIVVEEQAPDGSFSRAVQYVDQNTFDIIDIVPSQGSLPSDGAVADLNNDGFLDLVVAYKASNSVVVLFNDGHGSFYDTTDLMNPFVNQKSVTLVGSPNAIDLDPANPTRIAVAGVGEVNGKTVGTLELLSLLIDQNTGDLALSKVGAENTFSSEVNDVALTRVDSGFTGVIFALKNGTLSTATFAQQQDGQVIPAFNDSVIFGQIAGGVRRIDISSDGTTLAVLGPNAFGVGIYDTTSITPVSKGTLPPAGGGNPSVIRFVDDGVDNTPDNLFVLSSGAGSSRISLFTPDAAAQTGYSLSRTFDSGEVFRNFSGFGSSAAPGFAAVTSALNTFTFSSDFSITTQSTLPFSGKSLVLTAGDGGNGLDLVNNFGAGGAGGSIFSLNAEAVEISLSAGNGGNSQKGPGGAGGSFSNPATFVPASGGGAVAPRIVAEDALTLAAGNGGSPAVGSTVASGGAGGSLRGLNLELIAGDVSLIGGTGGNSRGAKAGAGGSLVNIVSLARDGNLFAAGGIGGNALDTAGAGGAGGSVTNFSHTLLLDPDVEADGNAYDVSISGGIGGTAAGTVLGAVGGAGGALSGITLDLDNSDLDIANLNFTTLKDGVTNPVTIELTGGMGGTGAVGGAGGSISGLNYNSHHDQFPQGGGIYIGYFTMNIKAGDGGVGTTGAGGAGGSFIGGQPISGITGFDPDGPASILQPLEVVAGDGGGGKTLGGVGGSIKNLQNRNSLAANGAFITGNHLSGAELIAGDGGGASAGNGGAGGSILNSSIGVSGTGATAAPSGLGRGLFALAGAGGTGAGTAKAKGGAGGAVSGGTYGLVDGYGSNAVVYKLAGGAGGTGAAVGGAGGALTGVAVNIHQQTDSAQTGDLGGVSILAAGNGGIATDALGKGGKGGSVSKVSQLKDINSILTAIYAGNGGDAATGTGGLGGSVTSVKTAGFIGQPSDSSTGGTDGYGVFHPSGIPQGLFVGRGGAGTVVGKAGSVSSVSARQIAAIAAISATANQFVAAEKVSGVKADVIGYDADHDGNFDGVSPVTGIPIDGFIFAKTITGVTGTHTNFIFDV